MKLKNKQYKKISNICMAMLIWVIALFAQAPDTQWTRSFGSPIPYDDYGRSVQQTSDGGYIIAGYTAGINPYYDVWLIKTDANGYPEWMDTLGGTDDDRAYSVQQTRDDGFIVAGYTKSFSGVYLIKTDAQGNVQWEKTYGSGSDEGMSVKQTTDEGYIIAGTKYPSGAGSDVYLIKTGTNGDILWTKTYGGGGQWDDDCAYSVEQTSDRGYIITGSTELSPDYWEDVWLIKTDSLGDTLWTRIYGGTEREIGYSVQQTFDGGYIIAGMTRSFGAGEDDVYLIKTSADGDTLWTKTYGGRYWDEAQEVKQLSDNGYIITGSRMFVLGAPYREVYLIRTDPLGNYLWSKTIGQSHEDDMGFSVDPTSDGGYIITGWTVPPGESVSDVWLIKMEPELAIKENISLENRKLKISVSSFFKDEISIKFSNSFSSPLKIVLYDICGKPVFKKFLSFIPFSLNLSDNKLAKLPSGIYFLKISDGKKVFSHFKILKLLK